MVLEKNQLESVQEVEIEKRWQLTPKDYEKLHKFTSSTIIQKNSYFDTKNFELKKKGMTLRLREVDKKKVYTLKTKISYDKSGYSIAEEIDSESLQDLVQKIGGLQVEMVYNNQNTRSEIYLLGNLKLELDHTVFLNKYEYFVLEYECQDKSKADENQNKIETFLKQHDVSITPNSHSKSELTQLVLHEKTLNELLKNAVLYRIS